MQYLFLVYAEETGPGDEAFDRACRANDAVLRESGYLLTAMFLQNGGATLVRVRNGELSLSDGPAAGTEEQPGALYVINARDLNEAVRVASNMPQARRGSIVVRSLVDY